MSNTMESMSKELEELVRAVEKSLRHIYAPGAAGRTGFFVSATELFTVAMDAEIGERVTARDARGGEEEATVTGFDRTSGLTLLTLPGTTGTPLPMDGEQTSVGALAVGVALPSPQGAEARLEMIRCVGDPLRLPAGRRVSSYLQSDGAGYPGFTGAPLLSPSGKLLDVAMPAGRGETFYLPTSELSGVLDELRRHGRIGVAYLGVRGKAAPLRESAGERGGESGYLLTDVEENSPAATSGLQVGDFIISIGGTPIDSMESLFGALQGPLERTVDLRLLRGDKILELQVALSGERTRRGTR